MGQEGWSFHYWVRRDAHSICGSGGSFLPLVSHEVGLHSISGSGGSVFPIVLHRAGLETKLLIVSGKGVPVD